MDIYTISFFGVRVFLGVRVEERIKSQQHTSTSRWVESLARCEYGHVDCCYLYINSVRPCDACLRQQNSHWFRLWLVASSAPSNYLNQCFIIAHSTLGKKNFYQILLENGAFSFNCIWKCLENVGHVVSGSVCSREFDAILNILTHCQSNLHPFLNSIERQQQSLVSPAGILHSRNDRNRPWVVGWEYEILNKSMFSDKYFPLATQMDAIHSFR